MSKLMSSPKSRRTILIGCAGMVFFIFLGVILVKTGVLNAGRVYTVDEAVAQRAWLNGKTVTLRGFSVFTPLSTMILCDPPRCDCNQSLAQDFWLISEDTLNRGLDAQDFFDHTIQVEGVDCRGDECTITCAPVNPRTDNEMKVTGRFINDPKNMVYPALKVTRWELARERVDNKWQPVATGTFTIRLREP